MIRNIFNKLSKKTEMIEGSRFRATDFSNLPFKNNVSNLIKMFQLRSWFIQNAPHSKKTFQYANQMAYLHHQLNYLVTKTFFNRMLVMVVVVIGIISINGQGSRDWHGEIEPKFEKKIYGSLEQGASEGGSDDD